MSEKTYRYTDTKGRHCRYELTDTELTFVACKDGLPAKEQCYRLEDIRRINLNQRGINNYVVSITFYNGMTVRITSEDFSLNVGNQRAHHEKQRTHLRQWIDHLHSLLVERELTENIAFTSGAKAAYTGSRVTLVAFNVFMAGIAILTIASHEASFDLLAELFTIGLGAVVVNCAFIVCDTKEPTRPYSPKSLPVMHIPAKEESSNANLPAGFQLEPRRTGKGKVVAHTAGKGKFDGMLGGLVVQLDDGREFKLGKGFSDDARVSPPAVGTFVHFKYHGLTTKGLPRYASYLREHGGSPTQSDSDYTER